MSESNEWSETELRQEHGAWIDERIVEARQETRARAARGARGRSIRAVEAPMKAGRPTGQWIHLWPNGEWRLGGKWDVAVPDSLDGEIKEMDDGGDQ